MMSNELDKQEEIFGEYGNKFFMAKDDYEEEDEVYADLQKKFKKYIMLNKQITSMDQELKLWKKKNENFVEKNSDLIIENDSLREKLSVLHNEKEKLTLDLKQISKYVVSENEFEKLQKENIDLQSKIKYLEKTLFKFIEGRNNFEKPLGCQKQSLDKSCPGYDPYKQSQTKPIFITSMSIDIQKVTCHFYNQRGHYMLIVLFKTIHIIKV